MNADTRAVPLAELAPGSLLAEDLVGPAGEILLSRGTELSEKVVAGLARRGVTEVVISEATRPDPEAVRRRLDAQFAGTANTPSMRALRAMLARYHRGEGDDGS